MVFLLNIFMHMQVLGLMVCLISLIEDHMGLLLVLRTAPHCEQLAELAERVEQRLFGPSVAQLD